MTPAEWIAGWLGWLGAAMFLIAGALAMARADRNGELTRRIIYTASLPPRPRKALDLTALAWSALGLSIGLVFVALMILWLLTDTRDVDAWIIAHRPF